MFQSRSQVVKDMQSLFRRLRRTLISTSDMDEREARTDEKGGAWGRARLVGGARTLSGGAHTPGGVVHTPSGKGAHVWRRARTSRGGRARLRVGGHARLGGRARLQVGGVHARLGRARTPGEGAPAWEGGAHV
jgi:hypothetical protein